MSVIWIGNQSTVFNPSIYSYVRVVATRTYYEATIANPPYNYQLQTSVVSSNWFDNSSGGYVSLLRDVNGGAGAQWAFIGGAGQWPTSSQITYNNGISGEILLVYRIRYFNGIGYSSMISPFYVTAHYIYLTGTVGGISLVYEFSNDAIPGTNIGTVLRTWTGNPG